MLDRELTFIEYWSIVIVLNIIMLLLLQLV